MSFSDDMLRTRAAMEGKARETLEACVLGHLVRNRVVHGVRTEFLQLVQEVEGECRGRVCWPRDNTLCLPVFKEEEGDEGGCGEARQEEADSTIPLTEERRKPLLEAPGTLQAASVPTDVGSTALQPGELAAVRQEVRTSEPEPKPLVPNCPPAKTCHQVQSPALVSEDSAGLHDLAALPEDYHQLLESLSEPVPASLSRDREGLLKMRAQISMELLWLRQAIASRQNYLKIRMELDQTGKTTGHS